MRPRPLPATLLGEPFSVAAARDLGVGPARLRAPGLITPTRGVRSVDELGSLVARARAVQVGLAPGTAYSHVTAAELWDLPLPRRLQAQVELDVMTHTRGGQVIRRGCRGHRGLERRVVTLIDDLRVTSRSETWCDLADLGPRLISVDDLVVIGDACVKQMDDELRARVQAGAVTSPGVRSLHEALGRRIRPRGKVMLRQALELVRPRVKSPMESRSRLMFIRAGFPEPVVNLAILDEADEWLGEGDLVWKAKRLIGEYQGSHHGDIKRRSADASRFHLLEGRSWTVEELFSQDIYQRPRRIAALHRFAARLDLDPATLLIA